MGTSLGKDAREEESTAAHVQWQEGLVGTVADPTAADANQFYGQCSNLATLLAPRAGAACPHLKAVQCSAELQKIVDNVCRDEVYNLAFSLTIADPKLEDCPLVACSVGFSELTGYLVQEIVGRNCRFLLDGVPDDLVDQESRLKARTFCSTLSQGTMYPDVDSQLPPGVAAPWTGSLAKGELVCVQTNAKKSGELFRNMFYLREVDLDDELYVVGLQAGLPEDFPEAPKGDFDSKLQAECRAAYSRLDENMNCIERVLASQFWYSGSLRRQYS